MRALRRVAPDLSALAGDGVTRHVKVVRGPWKQTVAWAIDDQSPFGPPAGPDLMPGDIAVVVLDTEPQTVLCAANIGADRHLDRAITVYGSIGTALPTVAEVELVTGYPYADWDGLGLDQEAALQFVYAVEHSWVSRPVERLGNSSASAARILAQSSGHCTLCRSPVDLSTAAALEKLFIHFASDADVQAGRDWPALLCMACHDGMKAGGFTGVVDYWFASHPACPSCGAHKAMDISYGEPTPDWLANVPPWVSHRGCCVLPADWTCGQCGHAWA